MFKPTFPANTVKDPSNTITDLFQLSDALIKSSERFLMEVAVLDADTSHLSLIVNKSNENDKSGGCGSDSLLGMKSLSLQWANKRKERKCTTTTFSKQSIPLICLTQGIRIRRVQVCNNIMWQTVTVKRVKVALSLTQLIPDSC